MDKPGAIETLEEDILVKRYIPKKYHGIEANLYTTKWFDYRFMSPVACTRLYAKDFVEAYRQSYRRNFDARRAPYIRPLKYDDIFDFAREKYGPWKWQSLEGEKLEEMQKAFAKRKIIEKTILSGLWRGRQFADALGMPYPVFLNQAFDQTLRSWRFSRAPMPSEIYAGWVIEKIAAQWSELQLAQLYVAEDSRYGNDWYVGTREQNAHHEWLFNQAMIRGRLDVLWHFIGQKLIPISKVEARLDSEQLRRFHESSAQVRV